jgi:hypothetical protein
MTPAQHEHWCQPGVVEAEEVIQKSSMANSLVELLQALHVCTYVYRFKAREVDSQRANTRARDALAGISHHINATTAAYCCH